MQKGDARIKKSLFLNLVFRDRESLVARVQPSKCNKTLRLPVKCARALAAQSIFFTLPAVSPVSFDILQMIKVHITSSKMISIWVNFCQKNFS